MPKWFKDWFEIYDRKLNARFDKIEARLEKIEKRMDQMV
jgi:hypothetical protein